MNPLPLFLVSFGLLLAGCTNTTGPDKNETSMEYEIPPLMEYEYNKAKDEGTYEEYFSWYNPELGGVEEIINIENFSKLSLSRCLDKNNNTIYMLTKEGANWSGSEVGYYNEEGVFISRESITCGGIDCVIHPRGPLPAPQIRSEESCVKIREDIIE